MTYAPTPQQCKHCSALIVVCLANHEWMAPKAHRNNLWFCQETGDQQHQPVQMR
jgi:hypothetical protein